jgi:hypothetical protein
MAATGSIDIAAMAWAVERRMRTSFVINSMGNQCFFNVPIEKEVPWRKSDG